MAIGCGERGQELTVRPASVGDAEPARAVFLDKDGTLVEDVPYNVEPALIRLLPRALDGLRLLQAAGYRLVIVSNQSGVARGYFPESALAEVEARLTDMLEEGGVSLAGFYYCPHHPDGRVEGYAAACTCRKPAPGLLLRAARELQLDLTRSWLVGDILNDVEAGRQAGCRTVLIDNGGETEWRVGPLRLPHRVAADLLEAAHFIVLADSQADHDAHQGGMSSNHEAGRVLAGRMWFPGARR